MQNAFCQGMHGISLDDTYVPDLDFADDICLLEDNASNIISRSSDPNINITCSGEQLEKVEKFTNLDSSIQLNDDITLRDVSWHDKKAGKNVA